MIDYGVTMDLQKKAFIEAGEFCPNWLKITLRKRLGCLVWKYKVAIKKIPNMLSNTFLDLISEIGVTDSRHYGKWNWEFQFSGMLFKK